MSRIVTFLTLLALALAVPEYLPAQDASKTIDFPCRLGLESGKWKAFSEGRVTPLSVAEMLKEDPDGSQLVHWGEARYTSIWAGVQRKLAEEPQVIALLRDSHERGGQALVEEAGGDLDRLMVVARRFPWADSVHRALLEAGGRALRRGHSQLAWRCFRDVLARSADAEAKAQVGIWLAAAHYPDGDALTTAFKGIDPKAEYPWFGKKAPAAEILDRLAGKAAGPAPALKDLERKALELPRSISWLYEIPAMHADGLAVAGPSTLAWYDGVSTKPAWTKRQILAPASALWGALVAAPMQPASGAGRVYARWGVLTLPNKNRDYNLLTNLAAFDVGSGEQLWSTAGKADWEGLCPINDPAYADGRVYVLAVSRSKEYGPVQLVCLSAQYGSVIWKRELVSNHTTLAGAGKKNIDVAHYGNAVTVAQGSVFCSTNMGVVACCDARDGLVEWERTYPQDRVAAALGRPGTAPLVAAGRVTFLPRDAGVCLATDLVNGDLAWLKPDDANLHMIGTQDSCVILAGIQKVSALELDSGKVRWERAFPDSVSGRTVVAGSAIYAATRAKLYRLDSKTGEIAEEQEWGKAGPMSGLVLRGKTLYGTRAGADVTSRAPTEAQDQPITAMRVVHRNVPLQIDGRAREWDKYQLFPWESKTGQGKVLFAHDEHDFYIGVTGKVPDARGYRLDLTFAINNKPAHWSVVIDGKGGAVWDSAGVPVPAEARAAAQRQRADGSITCELAIPLASLLPAKRQADGNSSRLTLELALKGEGQDAPILRFGELLYLHRLTHDQEAAQFKAALALPDMNGSWRIVEDFYLARALPAATPADVYLSFIKEQPKSPAMTQVLVRLDRSLRKTVAIDPSGDILKLAEEVGVPEPARLAYKRLASAYLSQWVHVDGKFQPQAITLELADDRGQIHHATTGNVPQVFAQNANPPPIDPPQPPPQIGRMSLTMRILLQRRLLEQRKQQQMLHQQAREQQAHPDSKAGASVIPTPPVGVWHEMQIPLIWLDLHDRAIQAIAFTQRGGSNIYWDRTAVIVDGKESVLLEAGVTQGHWLGDWQWVADQVKFGKKAHTTSPPAFKEQESRHAVTFKEPFHGHLRPDAVPRELAAEQLLALAAETLPQMKFDAYTANLYHRTAETVGGNKDTVAKLRQSILRQTQGADVARWLDLFHHAEAELGNARATETVAVLIATASLPEPVLQDFKKHPAPLFVREWAVIGPFSAGDAPALDAEGIHLDREYAGVGGKVSWKLYKSPTDRIDLKDVAGREKAGLLYAACWVHSEGKQRILLKLTNEDRAQVWINPKEQRRPILDEPFFRATGMGRHSAEVELAAGWNEVLIKLDSRFGRWPFSVELREKDDSRPLAGVKIQAQPTFK